MRRFKFKLEAVRKHRNVLEQMRQQALAVVLGEMEACRMRLDVCRAEQARTVAGRPGSLDLEDIARREAYLDALRLQMAREERVREGIATRLEDARIALLQAAQAREAIERIRQRHYGEFVQRVARSEQAALDEVATLRHRR